MKDKSRTNREKTDTSNALDALDASSVIIENNGTESKEQDTSSRSGNDAHVDDADIRPIYAEEPMAEVQMTANDNVSATGQKHTEQPEFNNEGKVDQNAEQCHDIRPLPAKLTDDKTIELSDQSLESENVCLKRALHSFKIILENSKLHCIYLVLQLQMGKQCFNIGQQSKFLKENGMMPRLKNDIDVIETINNRFLDISVAKLLAENEQLHKENEHLKQTYKDLFDSIKRTRVQTKNQNDSLMEQLNKKSNENADVLAQIQKKGFHYTFSAKRENPAPAKPLSHDCTSSSRGTEFLNKTLHAYLKEKGIEHQTSTPRTPEQNDVVERRNRTLVEATRTMLSASKLSLFILGLNSLDAMADSAWIEAMQMKLHQFDRLIVRELIDTHLARWSGGYVAQQKGSLIRSSRKSLPSGKLVWIKQAQGAWYDELSNFLSPKALLKIYVDDIIFGSTNPKYSKRFEKLMHSRFEMSLMGEMKFFLGLQIHQSPKGIFINQAKYALEILKKHNMDNCHSIGTPLATKPKLDVDLSGEPVDQSDYRSKIGSLMYLTSSRPDLVQAVCYCARYQARPTQKHLKEVKRIFKYLKGTINMGLWYPKDSGFELTAFSDADHAGCLDTRKSTSGGIQFLGDKLVSWMSKKQNCTAMSSAEAEYVALSASCAQVMWMRTQLQDYGFNYNKIPLYCDSQSAIAISCNPVQHSRTKHIHTRYHFIKEQVENGIIELYFVKTEYQLADMFTKALPEDRFKYLVRRIGMRCLTPAELEVLTNETA
ncbi:retrovirus-related pol polyprotein from transposon TNT 1-94 [Tanacetum coccineum]|uniref:Retrovirus-related pol polyprotein from transposon TNT 1-94 n=1 Tax=Tanacetum coccineum TaxID=301880 RepID=A0ABQ5FSM7_9ASTR